MNEEGATAEPTKSEPIGAANNGAAKLAAAVAENAREAGSSDELTSPSPVLSPGEELARGSKLPDRIKTILIGSARDLADTSIFHHISLAAFLAWVGLGADGLSSSAYGPSEAFDNLGPHRALAMLLALAIVATVFIIASCYSHIIEEFPSGGGGYLVASKLLSARAGVVSGCALLVDYVLTITVSIAAAGDAIFGLLGPSYNHYKIPIEIFAIIGLIVLNLRGVKESVQVLLPIFIIFLLTHTALIIGSLSMYATNAPQLLSSLHSEIVTDLRNPSIGLFGMLAVLLHAYSMGAGTYTGLEAVSNSMPVMREPRVLTAKRTMRYMAYSLAFMAGGLIVAYLLLDIKRSDLETMNQTLTTRFVSEIGLTRIGLGTAFLWTTLVSEGLLLVVAAQAGFIDGPRVLANMAQDSWSPHNYANLSERLTTHKGIVLMGTAALAALVLTRGNVTTLVIMYSINVFVTFSLSMVGMCRHWWQVRHESTVWRRRLALFATGAVLCIGILSANVYVKFFEGGWVTIVATGACVLIAFLVHRHYRQVGRRLQMLDETLSQVVPEEGASLDAVPKSSDPVAIVLVGRYSGLGIHTLLNATRYVPAHFKGFVFLSVGVVDSGNFKGASALEALKQSTIDNVERYVELGRRLGMPSVGRIAIGTDAIEELDELCRAAVKEFPKGMIFAGQLVFQKDTWLQRLLHNQTAYSLQRRLQWVGVPMVILPTRVRE